MMNQMLGKSQPMLVGRVGDPLVFNPDRVQCIRDKRISDTGCSGFFPPFFPSGYRDNLWGLLVENTRLNDCYFDKKDWRLCKAEVRLFQIGSPTILSSCC